MAAQCRAILRALNAATILAFYRVVGPTQCHDVWLPLHANAKAKAFTLCHVVHPKLYDHVLLLVGAWCGWHHVSLCCGTLLPGASPTPSALLYSGTQMLAANTHTTVIDFIIASGMCRNRGRAQST